MKEKFKTCPLGEIIENPQFKDIYGLREFAVSILDESEKRKKLDSQGIFNINKGRKKSLLLGWREGSFERKLVIEESKDREEISIGVELQCSKTKNRYFTEQYQVIGKKSEDPVEDLLYFTYINNLKDQKEPLFLDSTKTKESVRRIKGWLIRAVEFNCI